MFKLLATITEVVKHLPNRHYQMTHGRGGKAIPHKFITDDVIARLPEHIRAGLRVSSNKDMRGDRALRIIVELLMA